VYISSSMRNLISYMQVMKLLVMQFPPISRHFVPPRSKYSPQHPVLKHQRGFTVNGNCVTRKVTARAKFVLLLKVSEHDLHEVAWEPAGGMVVADEHCPRGLQTTADHRFHSRRQIGLTGGNCADLYFSVIVIFEHPIALIYIKYIKYTIISVT
jgi:hypothetical protein